MNIKKLTNLFLTICLSAICCILFAGCKNRSQENLQPQLVQNKFVNAGYNIEAYETFETTNEGMIGEIVVQIGSDQSPEEYLQAYFFDNADNAKNFLENEQNKNNYKIKQSAYASNGVTVTFGNYINIVYIATNGALNILTK